MAYSVNPSKLPPCFACFSLVFQLLLAVILFSLHGIRCAGDNLQLPPDGSFKIALFADLHFGEDAWSDWAPAHDVNSIRVMSTVLDQERPDFVVYLGDVITANNLQIRNATLYWEKAISPTRDKSIPWASVLGNHDDAAFERPKEWNSPATTPHIVCPPTNNPCPGNVNCDKRGTTRLELMQSEINCNKLSHSAIGPDQLRPSVSNYIVKLSSSSNSQDAVAYMYFLDSGGGSYPGAISSAQADWFKQKSQEINLDGRVPEIIYWHIPSQAYKTVDRQRCVGSMFKEQVAAQVEEMGIMNLLQERPSVKAIFAGHNHGLDWCCPSKNLWLCYARHTGYGGYKAAEENLKGARIVEITKQPFSIKSWIRMENGQMHSEVLLTTS